MPQETTISCIAASGRLTEKNMSLRPIQIFGWQLAWIEGDELTLDWMEDRETHMPGSRYGVSFPSVSQSSENRARVIVS